ncbi:MAG TPA: Ig-like domain-containing protein, partial [Chryseosolibacter sp.]
IADPVIQYDGKGSTASLSYSVKPNASGIVTITVVAVDNGSNVAPSQNSYSSNFQIEVLEINSQPTLNAVGNITVLEDSEQQNVSLTGITAGPGESQALSVAVTSSKPELFGLLEVAYTSPESTGLLRFKTRQNAWGTAQVSLTVTDNGPGVSPHVNSITRTFTVSIQAVNDPPVFTSTPLTLAAVDEEYQYLINATDADGDKITIGASVKPSWTTITSQSNGMAKLTGKPSPAAAGDMEVRLQARDASASVDQAFVLHVNTRPAASSLSIVTEEDESLSLPVNFFTTGYSDADNNAMVSIQVVNLPAYGRLLLADQEVRAMDTIPASALAQLVYVPKADFFGVDSFGWKPFDGYHFSGSSARVDISVLAIDDPPAVVFGQDTLQYEVNGEPALLSPQLAIVDPDNDTLTRVTISFQAQHYRPEMDMLEFRNTATIRGNFDFLSGTLTLSGRASLSQYVSALRSVTYLHRNTLDPILEPKTVSFMVHDGQVESAPQDMVIMLQYTFIEFNIPSGFTPNGDQANDTWVIDRPGGLEDLDGAVISVYNRKGVLVFRAKGFDKPWDGRMNGELLPAGSYFFTIDLHLRNKKTYKGVVTILR